MSSPKPQPTAAAGQHQADELDRIKFTYGVWAIRRHPARPGYLARRPYWDGAIITIEAPDLIILETRLHDDREQERQHRRQPF
jgi:hypothetical protein